MGSYQNLHAIHKTRRDNLRQLIEEYGGPTALAKRLAHSNGSFLAQLAGPHPSRDISEKVARAVESKLRLVPGWMDEEDHALREAIRALPIVGRHPVVFAVLR